MSKKILILHGWGGSDFPHWQSWLAGELARNYGCINFLKFSDADHPKLNIWTNELIKALENFQPDVVICHSLANTLWFHLSLTKKLKQIEKLYLIAPPSLKCHIEELNEFFPVEIPTTLNAAKTLLVCSDNDPYISVEEAKKLQKALNTEIKILENAGHINGDSGYGEWPWLLQEITSS